MQRRDDKGRLEKRKGWKKWAHAVVQSKRPYCTEHWIQSTRMLTLLSFNQDRTCLAAASASSFAIYNCDPFDSCYRCAQHTVTIAEMLFSTSLVAIVDPAVGTSCLRIINTKKNSTICELAFPSRIVSVKMNRKRIVVFLATQVLIYDVSCMKLLQKIELSHPCVEANGTQHMACDLSSSDLSVLAFQQFDPLASSAGANGAGHANGTGNGGTNSSHGAGGEPYRDGAESDNLGSQSGNAVIFDALKLSPLCIINCHKTALQILTLSENGVLLASASKKGTIIRIFNTQTGSKLCEFRRGSLPASICSLSFNSNNTILACSSTTGTVHFFSVPDSVAQLGVSKDFASAPLSTPPTATMDSSVIDTPSTTSSSPSSPNKTVPVIPSNELPNSSSLTTEETDEVQKLMASVDNLERGGKHTSALQKTKNLTSMLWSQSKQYLPVQISSMLEPKRDYAFIRLPATGDSMIGLLENTCYIATADGMFLQYNIPSPSVADALSTTNTITNSPIECKLVKHHQVPL